MEVKGLTIEEEAIERNIREFSPGTRLLSLIPLTGDASNRAYYRIRVKGFKYETMIMMKLNIIDKGIVSEEIINLQKEFTELPFINIQRFLRNINVRVPEVYFYSPSEEVIFLEDFGDNLMWEVLKTNKADAKVLYRQAIDQLLHMQFQGIKNRDDRCYAFWHGFDNKLFMWEFLHFLEYGIEKRKGEMPREHRDILISTFEKITKILTEEKQVLTHRDYHSRNLMVLDNELGILDFQDALLGPPEYDLASLLRDSYVDLEERFVYECLDYYIEKAKELHGVNFDGADFIAKFDFASIQRNLKAAGRFHYIDIVKKNPNYLQFVPGTLKKVKRNMLKYDWMKEPLKILAEYLEEFR